MTDQQSSHKPGLTSTARPLTAFPASELQLELHLRAGPRYQCQSAECRAYEDAPGMWDTCPSCGKKGYLCGSFVLDTSSPSYQKWMARTFAKYRQDHLQFSAKSRIALAKDAVRAANQERCTCTSFVKQYEGGCCCDRSIKVRLAKANLDREIEEAFPS